MIPPQSALRLRAGLTIKNEKLFTQGNRIPRAGSDHSRFRSAFARATIQVFCMKEAGLLGIKARARLDPERPGEGDGCSGRCAAHMCASRLSAAFAPGRWTDAV